MTRPTVPPVRDLCRIRTTTGYNSPMPGDRASECDGDERIVMAEDARREHKQRFPTPKSRPPSGCFTTRRARAKPGPLQTRARFGHQRSIRSRRESIPKTAPAKAHRYTHGCRGSGASQPPGAGHARLRPDQSRLDSSDLVEEVWSRLSEWGGTCLWFWVGWPSFSRLSTSPFSGTSRDRVLTLIFGCIAAAILSYPILITLGPPVRITPEQGLRDYYGALSTTFPIFVACGSC